MAGLGLIAALALATQAGTATPAPASRQPREAPAGIWRQAEDHFTFTTANIDVPNAPGVVRFTRTFEFSRPGEGLDTGLRYDSPDGQVFATVYAYFPGLPDAPFVAFTTDWALHVESPNLHPTAMHSVAAGGRQDVAIRADYANYRDSLASSAAFIRVGRWIIKIRVSGPEARRAEVLATMEALLSGIRFNGPLQPQPAAPFAIADCAGGQVAPAHLVPDDPPTVLEEGVIATIDSHGMPATDRDGRHANAIPARIGQTWCTPTTIRTGQVGFSILRAPPPSPSTDEARSILLMPINDAGEAVEEVAFENHRFVLLYHRTGRSFVLGTYDGPLTDSQIIDVLGGGDRDAGRVRASVEFQVNGDTRMNLNVALDGAGHHN